MFLREAFFSYVSLELPGRVFDAQPSRRLEQQRFEEFARLRQLDDTRIQSVADCQDEDDHFVAIAKCAIEHFAVKS